MLIDNRELISPSNNTAIKQVVVFMPDDPYWLLLTLLQVSILLNLKNEPLPILILSRSPVIWLKKTLRNLVDCSHRLSKVYISIADLPCIQLASKLENFNASKTKLELLVDEKMMVQSKQPEGLTKIEINALLAMLCGESIITQAKKRGVSTKTLYIQRRKGINKIVESHPHYTHLFPSVKK